MWQWKVILGTGPIQIPVINTHGYFPIFLRHRNNVCNPISIGYRGKETGFQLFFYFFFDLQNNRRFHPSKGLPHWKALGFDWNSMHNNLSIQLWHILVRPSKDFSEFLG